MGKQQIDAIRHSLIRKIREAVDGQNGCIGTHSGYCGISEPDEREYEIAICIHNPSYPEAHAGYTGATLHSLHIDDVGLLMCAVGDDSHYDDWNEPIDNVQTEGLLKIVEWLTENGFISEEGTWRCESCGSLNVQQRAWVNVNTTEVESFIDGGRSDYYCEGCEEHNRLVRESELIATIEKWFTGDLLPDDDEVISGLNRNDFATDEHFETACKEKWDARDVESKIGIWRELTRDKSNES